MAAAHGAGGWMARNEVLATGLVTGLAGGVAMAAVAMAGAAAQDVTPLQPLLVIGESFVGPGAFEGAGARAAFGAVVHLATSAALGVLLAAILPRDFPMASAIGVGVGFVMLLLMAVIMPIVVPWVNPGLRGGMQGIGGTWVVAHAVFGVVLGLGPAFRRAFVHAASAAPAAGGAHGAVTRVGAAPAATRP